MKRIPLTLLMLIICIATVSNAMAQEKKTENRIKVVIDDGNGGKTVLDTVFNGSMPEKIGLEDGKYVYIKKGGEGQIEISEGKGSGMIMVTASTATGNGNELSNSKSIVIKSAGDRPEWQSAGGSQVFVLSDGKVVSDADGKTFTITMSDERGDDNDASRFVIAKDGMVITVEGNDEEKARELMDVIREHMNIKDADEVKDVPATGSTRKGKTGR